MKKQMSNFERYKEKVITQDEAKRGIYLQSMSRLPTSIIRSSNTVAIEVNKALKEFSDGFRCDPKPQNFTYRVAILCGMLQVRVPRKPMIEDDFYKLTNTTNL